MVTEIKSIRDLLNNNYELPAGAVEMLQWLETHSQPELKVDHFYWIWDAAHRDVIRAQLADRYRRYVDDSCIPIIRLLERTTIERLNGLESVVAHDLPEDLVWDDPVSAIAASAVYYATWERPDQWVVKLSMFQRYKEDQNVGRSS